MFFKRAVIVLIVKLDIILREDFKNDWHLERIEIAILKFGVDLQFEGTFYLNVSMSFKCETLPIIVRRKYLKINVLIVPTNASNPKDLFEILQKAKGSEDFNLLYEFKHTWMTENSLRKYSFEKFSIAGN